MGPLLFIIYSSQLFNVIEKHLTCVHCFTELYVSFKPDGQVSQPAAMRAMERYIADIRRWMISIRRRLDADRTEVLLIETQYQVLK